MCNKAAKEESAPNISRLPLLLLSYDSVTIVTHSFTGWVKVRGYSTRVLVEFGDIARLSEMCNGDSAYPRNVRLLLPAP